MKNVTIPRRSLLEEMPWVREYMPTLQRRTKWVKSRRNVQIGHLVLLAEDKIVRNRWPMDRVVEVFTGEDGGVRSSPAKTASAAVMSCLFPPIIFLCFFLSRDLLDFES